MNFSAAWHTKNQSAIIFERKQTFLCLGSLKLSNSHQIRGKKYLRIWGELSLHKTFPLCFGSAWALLVCPACFALNCLGLYVCYGCVCLCVRLGGGMCRHSPTATSLPTNFPPVTTSIDQIISGEQLHEWHTGGSGRTHKSHKPQANVKHELSRNGALLNSDTIIEGL